MNLSSKRKELSRKTKVLSEISDELKKEFHGIDDQIDKIISSISGWYCFPELLKRPVIVNVWGLTGVGKTALIRSLVTKLNFADKFVEIQMNSSERDTSSLYSEFYDTMLESNSPGIILLDEFQKFRTIAQDGGNINSERYNDVWMLLSDGKLSCNPSPSHEVFRQISNLESSYGKQFLLSVDLSFLNDFDRTIPIYLPESTEEDSDSVDASLCKNIPEHVLKCTEVFYKKGISYGNINPFAYVRHDIFDFLLQAGAYAEKKTKAFLKKTKNKPTTIEFYRFLTTINLGKLESIRNFEKLLIFVCGNLDSIFESRKFTNNIDIDADAFREFTKKITVFDVKKELNSKFHPEQVSRLGNTHVIYPSLSKDSYRKIIISEINNYISPIKKLYNISIEIDESVVTEIYNNSVYPSQGVRPVFSSIQTIIGSNLLDICKTLFDRKTTHCKLFIRSNELQVIVNNKDLIFSKKIELPKNDSIVKISNDNRIITCVHEAGHAVAYSLLLKCCPHTINVSEVSDLSKGSLFCLGKFVSLDDITNQCKILLAGNIACSLIFPDKPLLGYSNDYEQMVNKLFELYSDNNGKFVNGSIVPGGNFYFSDSQNDFSFKPKNVEMENEIKETIKSLEREVYELLKNNINFLLSAIDYLFDSKNCISNTEWYEFSKNYIKDLCLELTDTNNVTYYEDYKNKKQPFFTP